MSEGIDRALAPVRQGLEADGFVLNVVESTADRLHLRVEPKDVACLDCLVPEPMLEAMVRSALRGEGLKIRELKLEIRV